MKSLQDYVSIYRGIVDKLGISGESPEVLVQLLANATYISEVEHIIYTQEASLEKATLMNSKIQHCMNEMYSVYRGQCPRIILNLRPSKYFTFNPYDVIATSNNFKVYYLGYWSKDNTGHTLFDGIQYGPITISPNVGNDDTTYPILGFIAKETVEEKWETSETTNLYYVESASENLSNDLLVKLYDEVIGTTRLFSEHITEGKVFDLTIPSFGSRLYLADVLRSREENLSKTGTYTPANVKVEALWFKYTTLDDYNPAELKKVQIRGAELIDFNSEFVESHGLILEDQLSSGIYVVNGNTRDTLQTIHYRANRDRYVNSIIRTNSDIGTLLEESFPDKVKKGGTSYEFRQTDSFSYLDIYYVPKNSINLLTEQEKSDFISQKKGYYVTDNIEIMKGYQYTAVFNIDLELYSSGSVDSEVKEILLEYQEKFNCNLRELLDEIRSLISKISNVKQVKAIDIIYVSEDNSTVPEDVVLNDLNKTYFIMSYVINSSVQTKS
jgi:hypothetical protein